MGSGGTPRGIYNPISGFGVIGIRDTCGERIPGGDHYTQELKRKCNHAAYHLYGINAVTDSDDPCEVEDYQFYLRDNEEYKKQRAGIPVVNYAGIIGNDIL